MKKRMISTLAGVVLAGTIGVSGVAAQTAVPTTTVPGVQAPPATSQTASPTTTVPGVQAPPTTTEPIGGSGAGGPGRGGRGGPGVGGPADDTTQEGAARSLNRVYDEMGRYTSELSGVTAPSSATTLFNQAKTYYSDALSAYNSGNYARSAGLSRVSSKLIGAAKGYIRATITETSTTVPGVQAPPSTGTTDNGQERAARELNHAYRQLGEATALSNPSSAVTGLLDSAKTAYTSALSDYNAQKYQSASGKSAAARNLAEAAQALYSTASN